MCYKVVNLLAETQEQLRKQRKRGMPTVRGGSLFPSMGAAPQPDSIASELESSLYSELSVDSGISADRMYVTLSYCILKKRNIYFVFIFYKKSIWSPHMHL